MSAADRMSAILQVEAGNLPKSRYGTPRGPIAKKTTLTVEDELIASFSLPGVNRAYNLIQTWVRLALNNRQRAEVGPGEARPLMKPPSEPGGSAVTSIASTKVHGHQAKQKAVEVLQPKKGMRALRRVTRELDRHGLQWFRGGSLLMHPRLNVLTTDGPAVGKLVTRLAKKHGWRLRCKGRKATIEDFAAGTPIELWMTIYIDKNVHPHRPFVTIVELEFWTATAGLDGQEKLVPDRPTSNVSSLPANVYIQGLDIDRMKGNYVDPLTVSFPIDVVYTWVDDSDPDWADQKDRYAGERGRPQTASARATLRERFRNRDELRYSLRSVDMYAPWVRQIYLVTYGHTPKWLNDNPRIKVIPHEMIYRDKSALPTFNSSSIETQLHHVPGLAEHFIYFNDDVFLGRPTYPSDFFMPRGQARIFPSNGHAVPEHISEANEEYIQADKNAILLFRRDLGMSPSALMYHTPLTARKSVLNRMEKMYQAEFDACMRNKFRAGDTDLRPIAFMFPYFALAQKRAVISQIAQQYIGLRRHNLAAILQRLLDSRSAKTFCLNDAGVPEERANEVDEIVVSFLNQYFPIPSSYEVAEES